MTTARVWSSPNYDQRQLPIRYLILHYTGMKTGQAALERLCDSAAKVSAHYCIEEDGTCHQLVAEEHRAWHAGVSQWEDVGDINSASIGIEIINEGHDGGCPPYPAAQIEAVIQLSQQILKRYDIHPWHVLGHSDVAPDRKSDPGEWFPWDILATQGVGLMPPADVLTSAASSKATPADYGYHAETEQAAWTALQRHYLPQRLGQEPGSVEQAALTWLLAQKLDG